MEGLFQTLAGLGPLKIVGLIVFIGLAVLVIKAAISPNNMPGGGKGDSKTGGSTTGTGTGAGTTNTTPPQNPQ